MDQIKLRDAREADRDAIQAVTLAAYEQYAASMLDNWKYYRQNILATLADITPAAQIVAENGNSIVGSVLFYPAGTQFHAPDGSSRTLALPEIRLLAVAPQARGQGIGAMLVQECIRRARHSGVAAITLHTSDMMSVAMRMYERLGFVRNPATDFSPGGGVVIKGYRFDLMGQDRSVSNEI